MAHKYGAKRTMIEGVWFDSKAEASWWAGLRQLERNGEISDLRRQVPYTLQEKANGQRAIVYKADFDFIENEKRVVLEVKGVRTAVWRLKERMFRVKYPEIELRVVRA